MSFFTLVLTAYLVLIALFLVASFFIYRHVAQYGYLSHRFKTIVVVFGFVAAAVLVLSSFFLFRLYRQSAVGSSVSPASPTNINF